MKILIVLALSLAVAMSHTIHMTQLSDNSLVDFEDNGSPKNVYTENNFDEELQEFNLTSFRILLIKAKLFERLNDTTTSFTVFAPSNKAISSAPSGLLDNATRLPEVLSYHVHLGAFPTSNIMRDMKLKTLLGGQQKIRFEIYSGAIYGSCQQIGEPEDETYDNGILDVMNGVMVPPEGNFFDFISKSTNFGTLLKYVKKADLTRFLQIQDGYTFLTPNDTAFKKLSADVVDKLNSDNKFLHRVLGYHFLTEIYCSAGFEDGQEIETYQGANVKIKVSGGKFLINNSTVIQADVIAYNGVVQVIDAVLMPPQLSSPNRSLI